MSDSITVTVPQGNQRALMAASRFLAECAGEQGAPVSEIIQTTGPAHPPVPPTEDDESGAFPPPPPPATSEDPSAGAAAPPPPTAEPEPAQQPEDPELDADGVPWDERIHAGTKTKTAAGKWKKKKGVDADEHARITKELQQRMGSEPAPEPAQPQPQQPAAAAAPPPPAAEPEPAQAEAGNMTFPEFLAYTSRLSNEGTVTIETINGICQANGFQTVSLLSSNPEYIPTIVQQIEMCKG